MLTATIQRFAICSIAGGIVTFVIYPYVGARKALVLGWTAGAALAFATRGWS